MPQPPNDAGSGPPSAPPAAAAAAATSPAGPNPTPTSTSPMPSKRKSNKSTKPIKSATQIIKKSSKKLVSAVNSAKQVVTTNTKLVSSMGTKPFRSISRSTSSLLNNSSTSSKWDEGVQVIDSILAKGSASRDALTPDQVKGLKNVQQLLLLSGTHKNKTAHLPTDLLQQAKQSTDGLERQTSQHILTEYGGVTSKSVKQKLKNVLRATSFIASLTSTSSMISIVSDQGDDTLSAVLPPQWHDLSLPQQQKLANALTWKNLGNWNYNIFELTELTGGHPLLFMGWAVLGSPYSQYWMDCSIHHQQKQLATSDADKPPDVDLEQYQEGYRFMEQFKIPPLTLLEYLAEIEDAYHNDNPYHNSTHAADVVQSLHSMIQMNTNNDNNPSLFLQHISNTELFCILLAAVVHDVGHPGTNNNYQINARTNLALEYNDLSVLEHMHASTAFTKMLSHDNSNHTTGDVNIHESAELNILHNTTPDQVLTIRKLTIEAVLHTDMAKHFTMVNEIKGMVIATEAETKMGQISTSDENVTTQIGDRIEEFKDIPEHANTNNGEDQKEEDPQQLAVEKLYKKHGWDLLVYMLHLADISNPAKSHPTFLRWTDRCLEEFFAQGDHEAKLGLTISPLCDRSATNRAQSQIGFLKFVVQPAFMVLAAALPAIVPNVLPIVEKNLEYWATVSKKELKADGAGETKE